MERQRIKDDSASCKHTTVVVQEKSVVSFVMRSGKTICLRGKLSQIKVSECDFCAEERFRVPFYKSGS